MMRRVAAHEVMEYAGAKGGQKPLDPEQVLHIMDIYVHAKLAVEVEADPRVLRTSSLEHRHDPVQFFGDASLSLTGELFDTLLSADSAFARQLVLRTNFMPESCSKRIARNS